MADTSRVIANTDQAAGWDGEEGARWAEHAEWYERASRRFWQRLVERGGMRSADRVLDIGCGTGRSAREAARIASEGFVLGVDLSSRMLDYARARADAEGMTNVRFEQADAQVHPFEPAAFDIAISTFGVMFFNDPVAAFGNIGRALAPEGRVAMLAWRDFRRNEWVKALIDVLAAGRILPEPSPRVPGPFAFADEDHVREVLGNAGFGDLRLDSVDEQVVVGTDANEAYEFASSMGIVRGLSESLDEQTKARALGGLREMFAARETADGVLLDGSAWLIRAVKG